MRYATVLAHRSAGTNCAGGCSAAPCGSGCPTGAPGPWLPEQPRLVDPPAARRPCACCCMFTRGGACQRGGAPSQRHVQARRLVVQSRGGGRTSARRLLCRCLAPVLPARGEWPVQQGAVPGRPVVMPSLGSGTSRAVCLAGSRGQAEPSRSASQSPDSTGNVGATNTDDPILRPASRPVGSFSHAAGSLCQFPGLMSGLLPGLPAPVTRG
jgi:hypothetical protein